MQIDLQISVMGSHPLLLYVSEDQEQAIEHLYKEKNWFLDKIGNHTRYTQCHDNELNKIQTVDRHHMNLAVNWNIKHKINQSQVDTQK